MPQVSNDPDRVKRYVVTRPRRKRPWNGFWTALEERSKWSAGLLLRIFHLLPSVDIHDVLFKSPVALEITKKKHLKRHLKRHHKAT